MIRHTLKSRPNLMQLETRWNPSITVWKLDWDENIQGTLPSITVWKLDWDENIQGTLPWAVNVANNTAGPDVIDFGFSPGPGQPGLPAAAAFNSTKTLTITEPVSITGPGPGGGNSVTIGGARPFDFNHTTLYAGKSFVTDITFDTCSNLPAGAPGTDGGAVRVTAGEVHFDRCVFTNNSAVNTGGALFIGTQGVVRLKGIGGIDPDAGGQPTQFRRNTASSDGGAIYNSGTLHLDLTYFEHNESTNGSGGAVASNGVVYGGGAWFFDNKAHLNGGGLYVSTASTTDSELVGASVRFTSNLARTGAEIAILDGNLKLKDCVLEGNKATDNGGGVYVNAAIVSAEDVQFFLNAAAFDPVAADFKGSAIDIGASGAMYTAGCQFYNSNGIRVNATGIWHDDPNDPSAGWYLE
jgi:predicted outer membrane repeat protein